MNKNYYNLKAEDGCLQITLVLHRRAVDQDAVSKSQEIARVGTGAGPPEGFLVSNDPVRTGPMHQPRYSL